MFNLNSSLFQHILPFLRLATSLAPYAWVLSTHSILCHDSVAYSHAVVFHLRRTRSSTFICIDHVATCSASRLFPLSCWTVSRQLQQPSSSGPLTPSHPLLPSTSIRLPCLHPSPPTIWLCCSPIFDLIMFYAPVSCCSRYSPVSYWLGSCTLIPFLRFTHPYSFLWFTRP